MNLADGKKILSDLGLNIFVSAKVSDLPSDIYPFSTEQKNQTICMIAHGGKTIWENLPHPLRPEDHPIDQFSIEQMNWFAKNVLDDDIEILFPNDQHTLPLQQLGRFFNLGTPSPIGIDISFEFGLWFAYRGVFLTKKMLPETKAPIFSSPCESCSQRPCLIEGRVSCPIRPEHKYSAEQSSYHQTCASQLVLIHC